MNKEEYGFTVGKGGFTQFRGVMSSSKETEEIIVSRKNNSVTVNFADGHKYVYSASVEKNSDGYKITDEREEWF